MIGRAWLQRAPPMFVHTDRGGYAFACDAIDAADLRSEAPGVKLPALVISGTHEWAGCYSWR